ncbi:MAG: hypothetical protein RLZZ627_1367, partial [Pseudomonadota bacterium]
TKALPEKAEILYINSDGDKLFPHEVEPTILTYFFLRELRNKFTKQI